MPPAASRRACDRCNSLKERCSWQQEQGAAAAASCARCNRLGFECLLKRPAKKPGRPRLFSSSVRVSNETCQAVSNSSKSSYDGKYLMRIHPASNPINPHRLSQYKDLSSSDQHLIQYILFGDHAFDVFLIGPSFWTQHRTFLVSQFLISRQTLQDACLALALFFKQHSAVASVRSDDSTPYKHASSALRHLREYTIPSGRGVSECLALGALILSFTYYSSPSTDAVPVCIQTLGLVKETYESRNDLSPEDLIFIPCFILPEIVSCLMCGSLPTLKFRHLPGSDEDVDRYTGLFSSLLPHLYDICELNNALSNANPDDLDDVLEAVDRIDQRVAAWRPTIPEDFNSRFTATEISQILCQAQVMRLGAILLIHRLRHPFGTNKGPALAMATAILTQLDLTRAATNRSILSITLPLLAACFEIQDEVERQTWLSRIPELVGYSLAFSNYVQSLVKTFWEALDDMHEISWYNMDIIIGLYH